MSGWKIPWEVMIWSTPRSTAEPRMGVWPPPGLGWGPGISSLKGKGPKGLSMAPHPLPLFLSSSFFFFLFFSFRIPIGIPCHAQNVVAGTLTTVTDCLLYRISYLSSNTAGLHVHRGLNPSVLSSRASQMQGWSLLSSYRFIYIYFLTMVRHWESAEMSQMKRNDTARCHQSY